MPVLTTKQRKRLRPQSFALEKERKYPIHDLSHAKNALARVAQHGTRAEIKEVKREVYAKYPSLRPTNPEVTKPLPATLEEYKADPYWREQQAEYSKRIKPFSEKADKEIKKVNDAFMAGKTSLAKNQAQRDAINLELDKQADIIRVDMGFPIAKPITVEEVNEVKAILKVVGDEQSKTSFHGQRIAADLEQGIWALSIGDGTSQSSIEGAIATIEETLARPRISKKHIQSLNEALVMLRAKPPAVEVAKPPTLKVKAKPSMTLFDLRKISKGRSPQAQALDLSRKHQITISPRDRARVLRWAKDQGSADVLGVDNPLSVTKPTKLPSRGRPRITPKGPRIS